MQDVKNLKVVAIISLCMLAALLAGAFIFYRERILFSDAAWISFLTINKGSLEIQANRYGSFITQMFPALGSQSGLPLKVLLVLYSASFNIFYFATGVVLYRLRRYGLVVLLALFFTIFVSEAYFWTNNEVFQGTTWMFLSLGSISVLFEKFRRNVLRFYLLSAMLFLPLAVLAIYTHPLVMITTAFLWIFFAISGADEFFQSRHSLVFGAIVLCIAVSKAISSAKNWYDSVILERVFASNFQDIIATFTSGTADQFWKRLLSNYGLIVLIFIGGIVYLVYRKKYFLSIYTALSCVGYFVLICLSFDNDSIPYMESEWMAILASAPFVYFLMPVLNRKQIIFILYFIFLVRCSYIAFSGKKYSDRIALINTITNIMREKGITKAVIKRTDDRLEQRLIMGWALPIETLYTSLLNKDSVQRTALYLRNEDIEKLKPDLVKNKFILPFSWVFPQKELNHGYFNIDTISPYRIYTCEEFFGDKINLISTN